MEASGYGLDPRGDGAVSASPVELRACDDAREAMVRYSNLDRSVPAVRRGVAVDRLCQSGKASPTRGSTSSHVNAMSLEFGGHRCDSSARYSWMPPFDPPSRTKVSTGGAGA